MTETALLTAGSKLYDHTGVFDWAEVDPRRQITTQTTEDVLVKVHEAKRNEMTYGFGFEVINQRCLQAESYIRNKWDKKVPVENA